MKTALAVAGSLAPVALALASVTVVLAPAAVVLAPLTASLAASDTLYVAEREDHSPFVTLDPAGEPIIAWIASAPDTNAAGRFDQIAIVEHDPSGWGVPQIIEGPGDYFTPQLLFSPDGARWLLWAEHNGSDSRIMLRRDFGQGASTFALGDPSQPDLEPSFAVAPSGMIVVVWQGWRGEDYQILMTSGDENGFAAPTEISPCGGNDREPVVAWGGGKAWIVWSANQDQRYNLMLRTFDGVMLTQTVQITESTISRNLHPEIEWDEESQLLWYGYIRDNTSWPGIVGKEPGLLDPGTPRLRATDGVSRFLPLGLVAEERFPMPEMEDVGYERYEWPWGFVELDHYTSVDVVKAPGGRIWCFYKMLGFLPDHANPDRYWGAVGIRYDGSSWSAWDEFFEPRTSIGWEVPVAVASADSMWVVWTADDRSVPIRSSPTSLGIFGHDLNLVVQSLSVDTTSVGPPQVTQLGPVLPPVLCTIQQHPDWTVQDGSTTRVLVWGDNHRHSRDVSFDGSGDVMFRQTVFYSFDYLGFDFLVPSDHSPWFSKAIWSWIPKWSRIYDVPGRFRVFAGYERAMRGSAGGDQNVMYRDPSDFSEASSAEPLRDSWHQLYTALDGIDALAIPHTTAQCGAVMDWEALAAGNPDSLPAPLRVMEVYQSARGSFEYPGCPLEHGGCVAEPDSGWVSLALAMGMKLGIMTAADHGRHTSYIGAFAKDRSRDAIFEAIYDRHCFGTSINQKMNVEFRVADKLMGSEVVSPIAPEIYVRIEGPDPLALIEVNKDGDPAWFVASSASSDTSFSFTDPDLLMPGTTSYYYLRVTTQAGHVAWTSPVWVDYEPPTDVVEVVSAVPGELAIHAAPNPTRGRVEFAVEHLAGRGGMLRIYDVTGRLVSRRSLDAGAEARHVVAWDGRDMNGRNVSSGTYFATLQSGGERRVSRFTVVR